MGSGNNTLATELWGQVEAAAENLTDNVNFYNALEHNEHIEPASNGAAARFTNQLISGILHWVTANKAPIACRTMFATHAPDRVYGRHSGKHYKTRFRAKAGACVANVEIASEIVRQGMLPALYPSL